MQNSIFTPYRVCPLGAHVDHQLGLVTGFAIDRGITLEFEAVNSGDIMLVSKNFSGRVHFKVNEPAERELNWGDFAKGAAAALSRKYTLRNGIRGTVEGTLPVGGLSSSATVIITYLRALCIVNDIHMTKHELINMAIWAERNYIGVNVGKLDQSCEVYCKKESLLYLDTKDDSNEIIRQNPAMAPFEIMIVFSGKERSLAGSAYNMRVDECKAAAYALMAYSGMEYGKYADAYLRNVPYGIFEEYKQLLPENWRKRAIHYYGERQRVQDGVRAWRNGDIERFGQLIFESGRSSIVNYETGCKELAVLQDIMEDTQGVYGGRFSGAGFNGSSMAIVNPDKKEEIQVKIKQEYLKQFPELEEKFSITFCKTSDGVEL